MDLLILVLENWIDIGIGIGIGRVSSFLILKRSHNAAKKIPCKSCLILFFIVEQITSRGRAGTGQAAPRVDLNANGDAQQPCAC